MLMRRPGSMVFSVVNACLIFPAAMDSDAVRLSSACTVTLASEHHGRNAG